MNTEQLLLERSHSKCELCAAESNLTVYEVPPVINASPDRCVLICNICREQIENPTTMNVDHWRCLSDSMWTAIPAVQVLVWRLLKHLDFEAWAQDLLNMLYLESETQTWAEEIEESNEVDTAPTKDSNGSELHTGDSVTLIKDLDVKGAGFTAKRGTIVKNISLTANSEQIEGRVNGVQLVLLSKFLKKA